MSVVRRCFGFAFLVLCGLGVDIRACTAVEANKANHGMEDPAHFADTLAAIQKIVDKMPVESQPNDSDDDDYAGWKQREKAHQWLVKNLVGKTVEVPVKVTTASIAPTPGRPGGKSALIQIAYETNLMGSKGHAGEIVIDAGKLHSGGVDWELLVEFPTPQPRGELNQALEEKLHQLQGQTVKLSGTVDGREGIVEANIPETPTFSIFKVKIFRASEVIADRSLQIELKDVSIGGLRLKY